MHRVYLVNGHISNSAVTRYAIQIAGSIKFQNQLLTLSLTSRMADQCTGEILQRIRLPRLNGADNKVFLGIEYVLNRKLSGRTLREYFRNKIGKTNSENDLIHYTDITLPPIVKGIVSTVTVHDLIYLERHYDPITRSEKMFSKVFSKNIERYKKFAHVIAVSNSTRLQMLNEGFEGKISVIYPPIAKEFTHLNPESKEIIRNKLGLPLNKKLILSVSSGDRRKNLPVIEETVRSLGDEFKLVRVGPPCSNSINFEKVDQGKLNMIYNACDVLLFPSLSEGFGYPLVEAMATGLPIVASDIDVVKEVVGNAGIIVTPTVKACVKGVSEALQSRFDLIDKGLSRSKNFFTLPLFADRMNTYYQSLLGKGE